MKNIRRYERPKQIVSILTIVLLALVGSHLLSKIHAQTPFSSVKADSGALSGEATRVPYSNASDGKYAIEFGTPAAGYSIVFDSNRTGNYEIYKMAPGGTAIQLTSDTNYDSWWAKPSPDASKILFYRTPAGVHDTNYSETSMWMMNSDGSNLHQVLPVGAHNWSLQGHAEWSPNGKQLVMFGGTDVWITDTSGNIVNMVAAGIDPTFTPDGKQIVYISCSDAPNCQPSDYRVYRANTDGSGVTQIENLPYRADDPSTSPDGSTIVWETNISGLVWDIDSMNSDGTNAAILFADNNINTNPTWSPNNVIYFTKTDPSLYTGYGLWSMNKDGSDLQLITKGQTGSNEYVSVIP